MADHEATPTFSTWESYFYPETYDPNTRRGTLINKLGERDPIVLSMTEYGLTAGRQTELDRREILIPRSYDAEHLRAIHRHLFQDLYHWAGEYRTVDMFKGAVSRFPRADIDRYLGDAHRIIVETQWPSLDRTGFAMKAAEVFAYVNQAHPFREGNGRASKVFMAQVAELSSFRVIYDPEVSGVTPKMWNEASMYSGPDLGSYAPVPDALVPVFHRLAQPAPEGPKANLPGSEAESAQTNEAAFRAAFPAPASQATKRTGPGKLEEDTRYQPPSIREQVRGYGYGSGAAR